YGERIASMLRSRRRYDDSLAAWRALEKMVPEESRFAAEIGEILEIQGDAEGAKAAYRRSLAARHQPKLWRALIALEKAQFDFAKAWEPDMKELLDRLPATEELKKKYPRAVAITVLDHAVVRVNDDGSAVNFVHLVFKLLDEKGVAKYHDVQRVGEMLEIRAILPDGTVMLPTGLKRRPFNMEGLVPGTVIVHRYVSSQAASPRGGYDGSEFFFQDRELRNDPNPVLLSRFVVIAPKGMKLEPVVRNFDGEPQTKELDGAVATIWEKRDMPRITAEYLMPPNDKVIPLVDYSRPEDFGGANWKYLGERKTTWPTPLLEDALADALAGATADREKLEAIYRYVNTEITGDRGTSRYPSGILVEKAGNRAQLFEALVRTAGIAYRTGRAMAWNGVGIDLKRPDASAFKRRFLWLMPKVGDPIAHFMGARLAPFGLVPAAYRGSAVFLASEEGGRIIRLREGGPDVSLSSSFQVALGKDEESASVKGSVVYRSVASYRTKRRVIEMSADDRRKYAESQLTRYFANPELTRFEFPDLETPGKPLRFLVEGTMKTYLAAQGDVFVADLGLPASGMTSRFVQRVERTYDLVLTRTRHVRDEYVIDLGEVFEVSKLPEAHVAIHDAGTYSLTWRQRGNRVIVRRDVHLKPARYTPDEHAGFVVWCKGIDDAEQRKLELRKR
ncbi:MAG: hypothetical protein O7A71_05920, partial [Chloroflexi bacterium]|nr:hypothetical protein [Chloroflexota bacterium]